MVREFRLPDIGEGLTEAEIVRWLVAVGDEVGADQPIVEVETDKAVVEIPSPFAGVVVSLGGAEGETIDVGSVLVTIGEPGEAHLDDTPATQQPVEEPPRPEPTPAQTEESVFARIKDEAQSDPAPIVGTLSEEAEVLTSQSPQPPPPPATIKALPVVRKLARDHGIDLETVTGTGPGGRITRSDVEAVIAASSEPAPVAAAPVPAENAETTADASEAAAGDAPEPIATVQSSGPEGDERRPMTRLRRTISANMSKSWTEIPHVTTFDEVDATRLLEVRKALGDRHGYKIPIEALVIKAVLPAIDEHPEFNASLDGDDLIIHGARDIGIAVDTPEGLMVAVIREAGSKTVLELADEVRRLGEGARERTLSPGELTGQTFTISNIGAVGGGHGTPIVPYGTVAILSVGAARRQPVVFGDELGVAPVMPLSLSYDHRVIDGAVGRRFMTLVLENLEEPALFLAG